MNRRKPSFLDKLVGFVTGKTAETVAKGGENPLSRIVQAFKPAGRQPQKPAGYKPTIAKPSKTTTAKPRPKSIPKDNPLDRVPRERITEYNMSTASMNELKAIWIDPKQPMMVRRNAAEMFVNMAPGPLQYVLTNLEDMRAWREAYETEA